MTVTHPLHPLHGERVEVVRVRKGSDPDLIIRLADGRHVAIAASLTDYHGPADPETPVLAMGLLDIGGLRQAARLVEQIRQANYSATCSTSAGGYDA